MRAIIIAAALLCVAFNTSPAQACDPHEWPCFRKDWSEPQAHKSARPAKVARAAVSHRAQPRPTPDDDSGFWSRGGAVAIAGRYLGGNPTGWSRLWCAQFMNLVEKQAGRSGTGSAAARSFFSYGHAASYPSPGDIAIRSDGSHVGYVASVSGSKFTLRSGNACGRSGARTVCDYSQSVSSYRFRRV